MKTLRIALLILCASTPMFAGDSEFRGVVRAIESNYGVHHMHIPLLGVALFFARPGGVSGLRLAVFENFPNGSTADLTRTVESSLGPGWFPFVRVRSRADRETTLIYTNPSAGKMRMMIVTIEPSEATVVELNLTEHSIKKWLKEPGESAENRYGRSDSRD